MGLRYIKNEVIIRKIYDYDGVNLLLVWQIICDDIPELKEKCNSLITGDTDS